MRQLYLISFTLLTISAKRSERR